MDAEPGICIQRKGVNFLIGEDAVGFDRIRLAFGFHDGEHFNKDYIQPVDISFKAHN